MSKQFLIIAILILVGLGMIWLFSVRTQTDPVLPNEQTQNPQANIITNLGEIVIELYEDRMPITAGNFISLAEEGFYDGTKFHRVKTGFMIQGGDPNTRGDDPSTYGLGGPGYEIDDEFVEGEGLSNIRGTISMANTGQPNSGGSQFFINLADNSPLDFNDSHQPNSRHPVFGRVIEGMEVVDTIALVETGGPDGTVPIEPVVVEEVQIQR